jgi:nicotinate-nucleotide adenylyltransferase
VTTCVALLGGSFDPVHHGHVALAALFSTLLKPDQLRVIPAGMPWQKNSLQASAEDRVAMLGLALRAASLDAVIDLREIERGAPTYTIDTLREVRAELGPHASVVFLIGADQLQQLEPGARRAVRLCISAWQRAGFAGRSALPPAVAQQIAVRQGSLEQLRTTPSGRVFLAEALAVDISATQIRAALQRGEQANSLLAPVVLDYIQQHNLYKI